MKQHISLLILLALSFSCEKRILLETEFPHQEDLIFCEVIGVINRGFFGQVTQVQKVEVNNPHQKIAVIIREEDLIIYDQTLETAVLDFPFLVKENVNYSIEIQYLDQIITSPKVKNRTPLLSIENLSVDHSFIDSLGFEVATLTFEFTPPSNPNTDDELYFAYSTELRPIFTQAIDFENISTADSLLLNTTTFIQKRLPNISNYNMAGVGLLSLDVPFFQYLKNINQLGIIPNDDIEGHHGNLDGGIGYFGVVNYDWEVASF